MQASISLIILIFTILQLWVPAHAASGSLSKIYRVTDTNYLPMPGVRAGIGCLKRGKTIAVVKRGSRTRARRLYGRRLLALKLDLLRASGDKAKILKRRARKLRRNYLQLKTLCLDLWRQSSTSSQPPACGDGVCHPLETIISCPLDCLSTCVDEDGDGYGIGMGCTGEIDCNDTQSSVHPGALELCHNQIDDNCDGVADEECSCTSYSSSASCNADARQVGQCLWVDQQCLTLPSECPRVFSDEEGNLRVNGEHFSPVGFWSHYSASNPQGYGASFTALVDSSQSLFAFAESPEAAGRVKMFAQSAVKVQDNQLVPGTLLNFASGQNVIAWEGPHEPDLYSTLQNGRWIYDSPAGDVERSAQLIRELDPCHRPVLIAPGISGAVSQYLEDHIQFVDMVGVQAGYRTPVLDLRGTGANMAKAVARADGKPAFLVMRISGYQPFRLRYRNRQPTPDEVRVQAFDAIINGAKGVFFYAYAKGISSTRRLSGIPELSDAEFKITESPESFSALRAIAEEIAEHQRVFISPIAAGFDAAPDSKDIVCQARAAIEESAPVTYLICINLADDVSPIFEGVSGGEVWRYKAQLVGPGNILTPGYECQDGKDNDRDGKTDAPSLYETPPGASDDGCSSEDDDNESLPGWVYQVVNQTLTPDKTAIVDVSPPLGWTDREAAEIHLPVVYSSPGTNLRFGLYADLNRDSSPDTLVASTAWLDIGVPLEAGIYAFPLPQIVSLQHDVNYFLLIQSSQSITLRARDMRSGARFKQAWVEDFPSLFAELHRPQALQSQISLNQTITSCEVTRDSGGSFTPCPSWTSNSIQDEFTGYGVHIYRLHSTP